MCGDYEIQVSLMKKSYRLASVLLYGLFLLASSEYTIHQNRLLNRAEVRDKHGRTTWYLRENKITGRTDISNRDGQKTGDIHHNKILNRINVRDRNGQTRLYLKENPFLNRMDIFRNDGQRIGQVRKNRFLNRIEVHIDEEK